MRRRAPLREPDMLTRSKLRTQAQNFPQGGGVLTPRKADRLELDFLAFLARHSVRIHEQRSYIKKVLFTEVRHTPEHDEEIDLIAG